MADYIYVNVIITIVILASIKYGKGSNNANYYLSTLAIITWFIPYPILAELLPKEILVEPVVVTFSQIIEMSKPAIGKGPYIDFDLWLNRIIWGFFSLGLLLFVYIIIGTLKWQRQLSKDASLKFLSQYSKKYEVNVYSVNQISSGILLGFFNPVVIISNKIESPDLENLIISHEKQHLKSNDNLKLFLLTLTDCLFWWNPLISKLTKINHFYIEAICDERASYSYGQNKYVEDLATLMLYQHNNKPSRFVCSATSNNKNNIARIKLLKESKKMTSIKKTMYVLVTALTISIMAWNTVAIAEPSVSVTKNAVDTVGAFVKLEIIITNKKLGTEENRFHDRMAFWVNFDEKSSFKIGEQFAVNFKAKNLGDSLSLEYELIEISQSVEKIISKPKLTLSYGEEAIVEIDNPQVSIYSYTVKATTVKSKKPS